MPRNAITLTDQITYLSILDQHGVVDPDFEPDLSDTLLRDLYTYMVLGRRFDERLLNLQRQGRIGTFPPILGQEAAHLGPAAVLEPSDWMAPSFRETLAEIYRGRPLESILLYYNGFNEGSHVEPQRNDLPISIPTASQMLHAVGLAWAMRYRKTSQVAMTFFGDGATSQGDFHEALNFAAVFQVPAVFVCQNNHWAISLPRAKQTRSDTIAQKAVAYGMPGIQVDGNDILATYVATREAVDRARAGNGPTLIECVTYRMQVHTTADDPKRYRSDEDVATWAARDPLQRFQSYLVHKQLLDDARTEQIEQAAQEKIQSAVDAAEEQMAHLNDPLHMFEHVYAKIPPHLEKQRQTLSEMLQRPSRSSRSSREADNV